MADTQADLEALAARLHGAAARLKAAGGPAPDSACGDDAGPSSLARARHELEAAGAAVRAARENLALIESRLPTG